MLMLPALVPLSYFWTAEETRVCGIDNRTYPRASAAQAAGVQISYDFPCEFPDTEEGLYERSSWVTVTGALLDHYRSGDYALLLLRDNQDSAIRFIRLNRDIGENLIAGDQIRISGSMNLNDKTVTADTYENFSAADKSFRRCTIISTNIPAQSLKCDGANDSPDYLVVGNTRIQAGIQNKGELGHLAAGDIIRLRSDEFNQLTQIMLEQSGRSSYFKPRLIELESVLVSTASSSLTVRPVSSRGSEISMTDDLIINTNKDTLITRKYFGLMSINEIQTGDRLQIAGITMDDSSIKAVSIKDIDRWKTR